MMGENGPKMVKKPEFECWPASKCQKCASFCDFAATAKLLSPLSFLLFVPIVLRLYLRL